MHFQEKINKNKDIYHNEIADQDLLNDILFGKIGNLPFKFGMRSPYGKDIDSDIVLRDNPYSYYTYVYSKVNYTFNPQNYSKFMQLGYIRTPKLPSILNISRGEYLINPILIHQFNGKWIYGKGLTIYRRIAQYYIRMAGIWNEMCKEFLGY